MVGYRVCAVDNNECGFSDRFYALCGCLSVGPACPGDVG